MNLYCVKGPERLSEAPATNVLRTCKRCEVKRSDDGRDIRKFRSFNHRYVQNHKTLLNLLEVIDLRFRKIVVQSCSSQVWSGH